MVVIPGVFRMRDAFLVFLPMFLAFFGLSVMRSFERYPTESRLVLAMTALIFVGPLMASFCFDQPYLNGLLFIRHSLLWSSFFVFVVLLRDLESTERFLRYFTVFIGIWLILLIVTKFKPALGIIHLTHGFYGEGTMMRFGEHRLYFPYGNVPIYLYCYALAMLLHGGAQLGKSSKLVSAAFAGLLLYAVSSTFTRILIISLLLVTLYALATCQRRFLRLLALAGIVLVLSVESLGMAMGTGGIGLIEESNLGRMVLQSKNLEKEQGRRMQLHMNWNNFLRSPLTGVGNLVTGRHDDYERNLPMRTYRKYGFFNASDTGYPKMAAEYGLLGLCWLVWFFRAVFRRCRGAVQRPEATPPGAKVIMQGTLYFALYLLVSGVTLPHFIVADGIVMVALALAVLAIACHSLDRSQPVLAAGRGA